MLRLSWIALLSISASVFTSAFAAEKSEELSREIPIATPSPSTSPSPSVAPSESASESALLWNRALETFSARDYKNAAKLLQEYVDRFPGLEESMDARYYLAQSFLYSHAPLKAIPAFRSVIEVRGKNAAGNEARTYLGQAYLDASKFTEAYLVSEELLAQDGISSNLRAKALLLRAHAQAGLRQNIEAEKTLVAFQAIAESDPELERETAGSFLVSLLLKANHCDALPSAKVLPEDQVIDQISRKGICVLEMGAYLSKASKQLNSVELTTAADTLASSLSLLRESCANPPLDLSKRSKAKRAAAKRELSEKLQESCRSAERLINESFKERENLKPLQSRILAPLNSSPLKRSPKKVTENE